MFKVLVHSSRCYTDGWSTWSYQFGQLCVRLGFNLEQLSHMATSNVSILKSTQFLSFIFSGPFVIGVNFNYLMLLYFLYQYCRRLEENDYAGKPADMAYMLLTVFTCTSKQRLFQYDFNSHLQSLSAY